MRRTRNQRRAVVELRHPKHKSQKGHGNWAKNRQPEGGGGEDGDTDVAASDISSFGDYKSWAKRRGIEVDSSVEKVPSRALRDMAMAHDAARSKYGKELTQINRVTYKPGGLGEVAMIRHRGKPFDSKADSVTAQFTGRFTAEGSGSVVKSYQQAWTHEMGHVVQARSDWMRHRSGHPTDKLMFVPGGKSPIAQAMTDAGYANGRGTFTQRVVRRDVSAYSATNVQEFHAEVFTIFNTPGALSSLPAETQTRLDAFRTSLNKRVGTPVL